MSDVDRLLFFALQEEHKARAGHSDNDLSPGALACPTCLWLRQINREFKRRESAALAKREKENAIPASGEEGR